MNNLTNDVISERNRKLILLFSQIKSMSLPEVKILISLAKQLERQQQLKAHQDLQPPALNPRKKHPFVLLYGGNPEQ